MWKDMWRQLCIPANQMTLPMRVMRDKGHLITMSVHLPVYSVQKPVALIERYCPNWVHENQWQMKCYDNWQFSLFVCLSCSENMSANIASYKSKHMSENTQVQVSARISIRTLLSEHNISIWIQMRELLLVSIISSSKFVSMPESARNGHPPLRTIAIGRQSLQINHHWPWSKFESYQCWEKHVSFLHCSPPDVCVCVFSITEPPLW